MIVRHNYYAFLFTVCTALVAGLSGCKKFVDVGKPVSTLTVDDAFTSNAKANSTVAGIYSQMMNNSGSMVYTNGGLDIYAGLSSDELVNLQGTLGAEDFQFYTNMLQVNVTQPGNQVWTPAYKNIYNANGVLEGLAASTAPQLTDSAKKQLSGEAKFIRAFSYFYLTNLFGDVPMPLVTDFNKTIHLSRTPQADVYKQILQDLLDAQSLLPKDYAGYSGERVRATKWAATALLSRVYLYLGDWTNAETQASAVIGNSLYSLPALASVFTKNSTEAILQLQQANTIKPYNGTWDAINFIPTFRISIYTGATLASFLDPATFNAYLTLLVPPYYLSTQCRSAFENGDKRTTTWLDSVPSPTVAPYNSVPYYYPIKYSTAGSSGGAITQYYMVLRLAEQYLIRAEARAQIGTNLSGAAADINVLRTRASLAATTASTKETLLTAVAKERQTELFSEWGHRWLDLKRTGKAAAVLSAIPAKQGWKNTQLLYPIPVLEITNDPNIAQNPGY